MEIPMQKLDPPGVYRKANGDLLVDVTWKDPDTGKRHRKRETLEGATVDEAIARRAALKEELRQTKTPTSGRDRRPRFDAIETVGDYATEWIELTADTLSDSTERARRRVIDDRIVGYELGDVYIDSLSRIYVKRWVAHANRATRGDGEPYARATRRHWWRIVKMVLQDIEADYGLDLRLGKIKPPSAGPRDEREKRVLSLEQLERFLAKLFDKYEHRFLEAALLATTGMRCAELTGLKWDAVDTDARTIEIRRAADARTDTVHDRTKTGVARRAYILPPLDQILADRRAQMMADQAPGFERGLVFPSDVGTVRHNSAVRYPLRETQKACKWLDISVTPLVLRRSVVSIMQTSGVPMAVTQDVVGHDVVATTEGYTHVSDEVKTGALAELFSGVVEGRG
jgi:integrase